MLPFLIGLLVVIVLIFLAMRLAGFVTIREDQVGVVVKRFTFDGRKLPDGRVVSLEGEAGYQARTLAPGVHPFYWPWQYKVEKFPMTIIAPGCIGLVIANDGSPMPVDRVLCQPVACDDFQSAEKFLKGGGQKGRQSAILTAGFYRINPVLFRVVPDIAMTKIGSDKVGIVTVLDGAPMPAGQMAAKRAEGHEDFQNPAGFIRAGGCRGLQEQIILAGNYNINPWFAEVEQAELYEVPIGYVGVVVSFVGDDQREISGEQFTHGNIVR